MENAPYLIFALSLSVLSLVALAAGTFFPLPDGGEVILEHADTVLCLLFFVDFLITLTRSRKKTDYMLRWGWLDLLSSIPAVDFLRWGRAARIMRLFRILRGVRSTRVLFDFVLQRRAESAFLAAALVSILLVVSSAITILHLEVVPEANIRTPEDALWWAFVTITTVGYGDKFPVTSEGRVVAAVLMAAGVGLFGTFTGLVASWFLEPGEARRENELKELIAEVRKLRDGQEAAPRQPDL